MRAAEPVGHTTALIAWDTNKGGDTQVEYGTTVTYGRLSPLNTALVTRHSVALSNLSPWTTYHYRVLSRDARGFLSISRDFTFTTDLPQDVTAATIRDVTVAVSQTSATISWTTDEIARGWVDFAPSPTGTSSTPAPTYARTAHTPLGTSHSRVIDGLAPGTRYEYRVVVMDGVSNWSYDIRRWFITGP